MAPTIGQCGKGKIMRKVKRSVVPGEGEGEMSGTLRIFRAVKEL